MGKDVEDVILKLIQSCDCDVARAETGIIDIDEIDKISRKSENPSLTGMCWARSSRRSSSRWRGRSAMCRPKADGNILSRITCEWTRPTFCSCPARPCGVGSDHCPTDDAQAAGGWSDQSSGRDRRPHRHASSRAIRGFAKIQAHSRISGPVPCPYYLVRPGCVGAHSSSYAPPRAGMTVSGPLRDRSG